MNYIARHCRRCSHTFGAFPPRPAASRWVPGCAGLEAAMVWCSGHWGQRAMSALAFPACRTTFLFTLVEKSDHSVGAQPHEAPKPARMPPQAGSGERVEPATFRLFWSAVRVVRCKRRARWPVDPEKNKRSPQRVASETTFTAMKIKPIYQLLQKSPRPRCAHPLVAVGVLACVFCRLWVQAFPSLMSDAVGLMEAILQKQVGGHVGRKGGTGEYGTPAACDRRLCCRLILDQTCCHPRKTFFFFFCVVVSRSLFRPS